MKALVLFVLIVSGVASASTPEEIIQQEILQRLEAMDKAFQQANQTKPDPDAIKKILNYYKLTDADRAQIDAATKVLAHLSSAEWRQLVAHATKQGRQLFRLALDSKIEENPQFQPGRKVDLSQLPAEVQAGGGDYFDTVGGTIFSKHVAQVTAGAPILIGGGFPFNQTQFAEFNDKISSVATVDLYDPVCTGLPVLYDTVVNQGNGCRPYQPATPLQLLQDEMAFQFAHSLISAAQAARGLSLDQVENSYFRLTRISYKGVTLAQQAHALEDVANQRGYKNGEALLAGLSYGGLIVGKMGAMYPGRYKALVLFSPGVENPAHLDSQKDLNALLEDSYVHRQVLRDIVHDIAFSPRYDEYLPTVLKNHDAAFRDSLQSKMLGELDLDLRADLDKVTDRVYMITGALDQSINPHSQIDAMRHVFAKLPLKGSYILVPKGGHALWGNPEQSAEAAVVRILQEIEKGTSGTLQDGGVYVWNDNEQKLDRLGVGLTGLAAAEQLLPAAK